MQVVLMGAAESYRAAGEAPGVEGLDKLYPGAAHVQCGCLIVSLLLSRCDRLTSCLLRI